MRIAKIFSFIPKKTAQVVDLQGFEKLPDDFAIKSRELSEDVFDLNRLSRKERLAKLEEEIKK